MKNLNFIRCILKIEEQRQNCTEKLCNIFEKGFTAVNQEAKMNNVYSLTLDGLLPVQVKFAWQQESTSVEFNVLCENFDLLATVVYNARRDGRRMSQLDIQDNYYDNIQRIIEARTVGDEVAVFIRSYCDSNAQPFITAIHTILKTLCKLGLTSEYTLVVNKNNNFDFGTPMYYNSNVSIGTIGRILNPMTSDEQSRLEIQNLFEGGEWAVEKNCLEHRLFPNKFLLKYDQSVEITVKIGHAFEYPGSSLNISVSRLPKNGHRDSISLLVVHNPLRDAEKMIRLSYDLWSHLNKNEINEIMILMKNHMLNNEMIIFAMPNYFYELDDIGSWRLLFQKTLRDLYCLGLTAQQASKDALVIVRLVVVREVRLEPIRLLSLIKEVDVTSLRYREIGIRRLYNLKK